MKARPFIKWVGGKTQLLPHLRAAMPMSFGTYYEPFLGGGALFWDVAPKRAILSDANAELVNTYRVVRDHVEPLIEALSTLVYDKDVYYRVRGYDVKALTQVERAARFVYLNRTCFNGLYRVNKSGGFNVPFGKYTNPMICDADNLRACSAALADAEIEVRNYDHVVLAADPGDFVYLDPPYLPASPTASFSAYTAAGFSRADQENLARVARDLVSIGASVLISNADTPTAHEIYAGLHVRSVSARRSCSAKTSGRASVSEVLVSGTPFAAEVAS